MTFFRSTEDESRLYRGFKRIADIILAAMGLILLGPLLLATGIAVRLTLGSPVLFLQQRPGLNEKPFVLFKFRTMRDLRDDRGRPLPDTWRLTRFGRFLRRTSLDELPELVNVLKGDMSLVGPRPLLMRYLPWFREEERIRFTVRPGLTGLAQISGRNDLPWDERLALDVHYARRLSPALDLRILLSTIRKVLSREGVREDPGRYLPDLDQERGEPSPVAQTHPKILVFGIYQIGVKALERLRREGYSIQAVVSKPDDPGQLQPVRVWAGQRGTPCLTPSSPSDPAFVAWVKNLAPDLILVAGYHKMIPRAILDIPSFGAFNLHLSPLPHYRGPCPYKWALINGEKQTGVTVFRMTDQADRGDVYAQALAPISEEDDAESLFLKLSGEGAELLCRTVGEILAESCRPHPQDESLATYQSYPKELDCRIDWTRPAAEIRNRIRGLSPRPGAWTFMEGRKLRVWKASVADAGIPGPPGKIMPFNGKILATTGTDNLILEKWSFEDEESSPSLVSR